MTGVILWKEGSNNILAYLQQLHVLRAAFLDMAAILKNDRHIGLKDYEVKDKITCID